MYGPDGADLAHGPDGAVLVRSPDGAVLVLTRMEPSLPPTDGDAEPFSCAATVWCVDVSTIEGTDNAGEGAPMVR